MVFFRCLARLCASDAESSLIVDKPQSLQETSKYEVRVVELADQAANDLAVATLHRVLSGLTGSSLQRIHGLLEALKCVEVAGATIAALYAVPDGGDTLDVESALVLVASTNGLGEVFGTSNDASALRLLPDFQQHALFKRMAHEKAPVSDCLDRSAASSSASLGASGLEGRNSSRKRNLLSSLGPRKLTLVAAVPLLYGSKICGALWLEQDLLVESSPAPSGPICSASGATSPTSTAPPGSPCDTGPSAPAPSVLSDPRALQSIGFACSICMLGAEGGDVGWVAAALAHLGCSDSLSALTAQLCSALGTHVRRRFVLEGHVTAVLVPPGPEPPQALLLQPHPAASSAPGHGQANNTSDTAPEVRGGSRAATGGGASGLPLSDRSPLSAGSTGGSFHLAMSRSPGANVLHFAQQQLLGPSHNQHPHPHQEVAATSGGTPVSGGGTASRRKLGIRGHPWANGVMAGIVRDEHPGRNKLRLSLDLSSLRARGMATSNGEILRSPSVGPIASSRSIVIPLINPEGVTSVANAGAGATPALHARAFPLQRTLLQAHLASLQQHQRQQTASQLKSPQPQPQSQSQSRSQLQSQSRHQSPSQQQHLPSQDAGSRRQASGQGPLGAAATAAPVSSMDATLSATAVVEDTQLHVQNVHKPSNDVCLLMGLRKTGTGMVPAGCHPAGGHVSMSNVPSAIGGGGAGACSGAVHASAGLLQSLVLLVLRLGEGAVLGLYVCFPRRLPGPLLEAVRASCQELVDKALEPVFRAKLRDRAILPEYDTLCSATPGSYAVVRSPSLSGAQVNPLTPGLPLALPSLSAAYMTTTTQSDLAAVMAGETAATNLINNPPELLSGLLSTGDMDVLLGVQGQGQGQGQGQEVAARLGHEGAAGAKLSHMSAARRSTTPIGGASTGTNVIVGTGAGAGGGGSVRRGSASLCLSLANRSVDGKRRGGAATVNGTLPMPTTCVSPSPNAGGGECMEPLNLCQLLKSSPDDLMTSLGMGMGGPTSAQQQQMLQQGPGLRSGSCRSLAGLEQAGFAASIITVAGVDAAATARQQLDLLVSSIHATINTDPAAGGANACPLGDLDALELGDVLGQGGGGTVFKGKLGTLDVAVKLMELPSLDLSAAAATQQHQGTKAPAPAAGAGPAGQTPAGDTTAAEKLCLNARREMLRNATELAVQSRVSHPNIVQIYATYNDVFMVPKKGHPGHPGSTYRLCPAAALTGVRSSHCPGEPEDTAKGSSQHQVACVAAAFELCDGGSLGSAMAARTFPRPAPRHAAAGNHARTASSLVDMKGIYMTLLDVALALRHLHSLNLVHRDVKPANLLLKSNPRDYRGFTVKLADFGFVLHLSETAEDGSRYSVADQACGTVTHMAPEALLGKAKIDASVDVYAFGILMWEMFSGGVRPFPRLQPDKIPRAVYRGARPTFADDIPARYRNLALACWSADPQRRPKASDLVVMLNGLLQELEG